MHAGQINPVEQQQQRGVAQSATRTVGGTWSQLSYATVLPDGLKGHFK